MPPRKRIPLMPCPVCGKDIPVQAKACHHCGACDKTGWKDDLTDGLDLPDDDFDYDKFVGNEFGRPRPRRGKEILWKVVALVLLIVFIVTLGANLIFH